VTGEKFEHPSMEPQGLLPLLKWLYDGYGGYLSEQARDLILVEIEKLEADDV